MIQGTVETKQAVNKRVIVYIYIYIIDNYIDKIAFRFPSTPAAGQISFSPISQRFAAAKRLRQTAPEQAPLANSVFRNCAVISSWLLDRCSSLAITQLVSTVHTPWHECQHLPPSQNTWFFVAYTSRLRSSSKTTRNSLRWTNSKSAVTILVAVPALRRTIHRHHRHIAGIEKIELKRSVQN